MLAPLHPHLAMITISGLGNLSARATYSTASISV
jgi:hypothetical protein